MARALIHRPLRPGGVLLALFLAGAPLACGGMISPDGMGDDGPDDGSAPDGGTDDGTGGTASVGSGGTTAAGGHPATGGDAATGGDSATACSHHSDCTLASSGCCGGCEPIVASDLVAMNWDAYENRPLCGVACGACPQPPEVDWTGEYFVARCVEENCRVVDVRDDYAECTTDQDCFLRDGSGCCEECNGSGYIAVSSLDFVSEQACPEILCAACDAPPPEGLSAQCNLETRRCEKVQD
jgi:hypothetical protein